MSRERELLRKVVAVAKGELVDEIKELLAQPEQEPVGWWDEKLGFFKEKHFDQLQPLYLSPPKRKPLSDEDIAKLPSLAHVRGCKIYPDGDMWCCLYGDDIQIGVAGFGKTPALAAKDFERNWYSQEIKFIEQHGIGEGDE